MFPVPKDELITGCTIILYYPRTLRVRHFSAPSDVTDVIEVALQKCGLVIATHDFERNA